MQIYDHGNVLWLEESLRAAKQNSGWPKKWAKFEGCLWILILNFQFMLIKLKWVWLDMVYSQSMIKKKKKWSSCVREEVWLSFEFWSFDVKLIRLCVHWRSRWCLSKVAPRRDHCLTVGPSDVCNYKNAIIILFP